jgi:hypothetical protein
LKRSWSAIKAAGTIELGAVDLETAWIFAITSTPILAIHTFTITTFYESEVEQVINGPREDLPAKNGARMKLGQSASGRYLQVNYVPDEDRLGVFIITAYELRGKALTAFRRRRGENRDE